MKKDKRGIQQPSAHDVEKAVSVLESGGMIGFPTETYYGLGVDPFNDQALWRLFLLKKRESNKPILVLVRDLEMLSRIVADIPEQYKTLMKKFWPGPLTLIFTASPKLPPLLTGESGTVGVRISSHPSVDKIFEKWPHPLTATSANLSGTSPAKNVIEIKSCFPSELDYILDGGDSPAGLCSSIVGLENGRIKELRRGQISFAEILKSKS